ncbi:MG2 domain-containing protein, partial [Selenomonas sp.]|uniref:MG2 domain-containing protein n=1 Tax=Selenomonas sp. TaxID=2053611 RepID=UPI0025F954BD
GNYNLRIKARSGLITAKKEVSINISSSNNSDTIISLDKGIYKPGDTIKYRALLIKKSDSTPKDSDDVLVEIFDGNENRVYSENSTTTEFGIVAGKFTLASEVNSGTYTISVSSDSKKVSKTFTVNPYVTPKFEVKIDTDKDVYQVGETANITLNAKYFFGEPVANANVTGKIGKTEIVGLTDEAGNFTYSYEMESTSPLWVASSTRISILRFNW